MLRAGMVQLVKKQRNYHIDRDSMIDLIFTNITGKVSAVIDTRPSGNYKKIKILAEEKIVEELHRRRKTNLHETINKVIDKVAPWVTIMVSPNYLGKYMTKDL